MKRRGNEVRIIGGRWRGRRIVFPDASGLRPSGDRVRETLFNWLQPYLPGARCLDLFAGSGVLGLEAVSRGAAACTLVERARPVAEQLRRTIANLDAEEVELVEADALQYLSRRRQAYDVVFLDPPFGSDIIDESLEALESNGWLAEDAFVYVERDISQPALLLPESWSVHRRGHAGQVGFLLLRRQLAEAEAAPLQ